MFFVIGKRLKLQGFIVSDHIAETPHFLRICPAGCAAAR
jgi:NADPH-dependent curcumin reductase CurA